MDDDKMKSLDFEQDVRKLVQHLKMQVGLNKSIVLGPSLTNVSPRAVLQEG